MSRKLQRIIRPLIECEISLKNQRKALREMYAMAVSNAPENEMENFTAKKFTPVFLALSQMLDKVPKPKKA